MHGPIARNPLFLVALVALTALGPLSIHIVLPALPALQREFSVSVASAQLALSTPMLAMAAATLAYGPIADRYGRRIAIFLGTALFLVGGGLAALATDMTSLLAGRLLQAAGGGAGIVIARAIVRDVYDLDRSASALAYLTVAYVVAPMSAPLIGGAVIDHFGWRAVFVLSVLLAMAILLLVIFGIPETRRARSEGDGRSLARGALHLMGNVRFLGYSLHTGFSVGAFFASVSAASYLMETVLERPSAEYGVWFFMVAGAYMVGNFVVGRLGGRIAIERLVTIGGRLAFTSIIAMGLVYPLVPLGPVVLFLPVIAMSFFQGVSMPNATAAALSVDKALAGTASGLAGFSHLAIGAVAAQLVGFMADGTYMPLLVWTGVFTFLALVAGEAPRFLRPRQATG
ncbi:MAG: multidrug effflux MFS transporter [Alphaproteobacteria bacterium]|nr:multidrug effflux MFS transporter [Alphaproteobacteria bacterium]